MRALILGLGLSMACAPAAEGEPCETERDCADGLVCAPLLCFVGPCPARCEKPAAASPTDAGEQPDALPSSL